MSIVRCPDCLSENLTLLSDDAHDFICNRCGEDFRGDSGS